MPRSAFIYFSLDAFLISVNTIGRATSVGCKVIVKCHEYPSLCKY